MLLTRLTRILLFMLAINITITKADEQAVLTIDPGTIYSVNGVEDIQAVTGMVCNGESRMDKVNEMRSLNMPATRLYLWVNPPVPWKEFYNMSMNKRMELILDPKFIESIPSVFDKNLGLDPKTGHRKKGFKGCSAQYWQLEQLEAWGAKKNIILHITQPHPRSEEDFEFLSLYYITVIKEVKKRYPKLDIRYVMFSNEPNYEYPRHWENRNKKESIQLFLAAFKYVKAKLENEVANVTLIGPGSASDATMSWDGWNSWTLPFIKEVSEAKYFNEQIYTNVFEDLLAWNSMLQAASIKQNGHRLPVIITELNANLRSKGKEWWKDKFHVERVFDEASILFGMMKHPDIFKIKTYFLNYYHKSAMDIWFGHNGTVKPSPVYHLYWLLRDLRGKRVFASVNQEKAKAIKAIAAVNDDKFVLSLFNRSKTRQSISTQMLWPKGMTASTPVTERLYYDKTSQKFIVNSSGKTYSLPSTITLEPGEIRTVKWFIIKQGVLSKNSLQTIESYAPDSGQVITEKPLSTTIKIRKPKPGETAKLRIAFYINDLLNIDRIKWELNGLKMGKSFEMDDENYQAQPILYYEKYIPADILEENNTLTINSISNTSFKLMFASITLESRPDKARKFKKLPVNDSSSLPYNLELNFPTTVYPGENTLEISLKNTSDNALNSSLNFKLPKNWGLEENNIQMNIPAGQEYKKEVAVSVPEGEQRNNHKITGIVTDSTKKVLAKAKRGMAYQPPFIATYAKEPLQVDGSLGEWTSRAIIVKNSGPTTNGATIKVPYTTAVKMMWDEKQLYVAMEVKGKKFSPIDGKHWWKFDVLEIFLDFFNKKKPLRDDLTMQACIMPYADNSKVQLFPYHPDGFRIQPVMDASSKAKVVETEDGFIMEASMPWESLTKGKLTPIDRQYRPKANDVLGCDIALLNRNIIGGKEKAYTCPKAWGTLLLANPEVINTKKDLRINVKQKRIKTETKFTPKVNASWVFNRKQLTENGLNLTNNQSILRYGSPFNSPLNNKDDKLNIEVNIGDFISKDTKNTLPLKTQLRVYLTPDKLKKYIEPYSMENVLWFLIDYNESGHMKITLYKKDKENNAGCGLPLWSGVMETTTFPFKFSILLNSRSYKISTSPKLNDGQGLLSGKHNLGSEWGKPLHFGVKSQLGNKSGVALIKEIIITE